MYTRRFNYLHTAGLYSVFVLIVISMMSQTCAAGSTQQDAISFSNIREYADFANAAYRPVSDIRKLSSSKGYSLSHYSSIAETGTASFLLTNDDNNTQIISVRGTSNIENAIVDVALKLTLDKHAGVRLHNGFSLAAQAIYAEIRPHLKAGYTISTTGHSLGGAVALILAMYLDVDNYKVGEVVSFGQPKVTNISGANKFRHLNIIRVVTPKDIVPLVPPFDPVDLNDLDIYWHAGREVLLLSDNTYAVLEGVSSMLRATKFTQEPLTENNIHNHQMGLYVQWLDKKIPNARRVPFRNDFNIFNLFDGSSTQ